MLKVTTCLLVGTSLLASDQAFAYCSDEKVIEHEIESSQFSELRLNSLAGDLLIETADSDQIDIHGVACTDRAVYLDRMGIEVVESGSVLEVTAVIPYHERDWHADYAYIDMTLKVPADISHLIKDSSGDLEVYGVKLGQVNDSSGDVYIRDTTGDFDLRDSSGLISVRDHNGSVELQDSSGDIDVDTVTGDVEIVRDSSGDIEIQAVFGQVIVERDSSGDIEIDRVGRSVTVGSDGSGSIKIRDVKGSVEIGSDGSGDIVVQQIDGDFILERKGSGDIRTAKIQGNVNIPEF